MIKVFLYIWQIIQNIIGLAVIGITKAEKRTYTTSDKDYTIYVTYKGSFGVTLGQYIILGCSKHPVRRLDVLHEYGHTIQSKILGPLYLIVIGLPSAINNLVRRKIKYNYYAFYTEAWADRISGVKR